MILKTVNFYVANDKVVTADDVLKALHYASDNEVIVILKWSGPGWEWYPSERYGYTLFINPHDSFKELIKQLPESYGV